MFTVHIIENKPTFSQQIITLLTNQLSDVFPVKNIIKTYGHFESFVDTHVHESSSHHVYFIDIDLIETLNGFELARAIRKIDYLGYVIFLTSHTVPSCLNFDFHIKAINFIHKSDPKLTIKINKTLQQIVLENRAETEHPILTIKNKQTITELFCQDIYYIETHYLKRRLIVHTADKHHLYHGTLKEVINELPPHFKRCHKSYILNPEHMKEIDVSQQQFEVYFDNQKSCLMSKTYIQDPLKLFKERNFHKKP